jgi:hypothetical protein
LDDGLRTLSGGQVSFQIDGFLAIEQGAVPDFFVNAAHAVREVFASVQQAPAGSPVQVRMTRNGAEYCSLTISAGSTTSQTQKGFALGPLREGDKLSLDITAVGTESPGSDLTVVLRF